VEVISVIEPESKDGRPVDLMDMDEVRFVFELVVWF